MQRVITEEWLEKFENDLFENEKRPATIRKYVSDVRKLQIYAKGREISKKLMIHYKAYLLECGQYKERSVNSYLVSANCFLQFMGWNDAVVRLNRIQREIFCPEERSLTRAEYKSLIQAARDKGKKRLVMVLQTICATGMRVSELKYVTVHAVNQGVLEIRNKGKARKVLLGRKLRIRLRQYIRNQNITGGAVFVTSGGKVIDRSNLWKEMKSICNAAGVKQKKVFPHNLRHLFAQCFYELEKDIAKLADVLGHSSIETTRIYIRSSGREHLRQLDKMELVV